MARNLSFSISNILRSDFPPPSRISARPRILYVVRDKEDALMKSFQAFQDATGKLNQVEVLGRERLCSTQAQKDDVCELLTSGCISQRKTVENSRVLEEHKEGKVRYTPFILNQLIVKEIKLDTVIL